MIRHVKTLSVLSLSIAIAACNPSSNSPASDTDAPSLVVSPEQQSTLLAKEAITFGFSEPVDITTLKLMADGSEFTSFSKTWNQDETEVTLTPTTHWPSGENNVSIEIADNDGNKLISEALSIRVNLTLANDQEATMAFGQFEGTDGSYYGNAFMDDNGIWLTDYDASALYFYNGFPTERDAEPDQVITSIEYVDSETQLTESSGFGGLQTPIVYNEQLFVADYDDGAVYIFDGIPVAGESNLGIVLGFPDLTKVSDIESCSAARLSNPEAVIVSDDRVLVADSGHNRVLIWNSIPEQSGTLPDMVLGQLDFESCDSPDASPTEFSIEEPSGVWSDGTKLLVVDGGNNRVLGWNTFPTTNGQAADFVLGQDTFFDDECNGSDESALPTANSLCDNYEGLFSNGRQIFVADSGNNRVLGWNDWPTENGIDADIVLGRPDFISFEDEVDETETKDNRFSYVAGVYVFDNH
jgi:hypothetical protein